MQNLKLLYRNIKYVFNLNRFANVSLLISFVAETAMNMAVIYLGGRFIDATAQYLLSTNDFQLKDYFLTESFQFLCYSLLSWLVLNSLGYIQEFYGVRIKRDIMLDSESRVIEKISTANLEEIEDPEFQNLVTFVPNFSYDRIYKVYDAFTNIFQFLISAISALVILYSSMSWSVLFLILIAMAEPINRFLMDRKLLDYRNKEVTGVKYVDYMVQTCLFIPNFVELRMNDIVSKLKKKIWSGNKSYYDGEVDVFKHYFIDVSLFSSIGRALFYCYAVYILRFSVGNGVSIGQFKAMFDYADNGYKSSFEVLKNSFDTIKHLKYIEKFFDLIDYEGFADKHDQNSKHKLSKGTPKLIFDGLDFQYPDSDVKILEDLNFEIKPGEKVAFVGQDSSGKSTLAKMLMGLYRITAGDFYLNEYSVRELQRGEHKKKIAIINQDFIRYNFSVRENITIGNYRKTFNKELYNKVLKATKVNEFLKKSKIDDTQILGKYFRGGKEVSPAHWQKLAIGRMLYSDSEVSIMDEPFTFLSSITAAEILKNIFELVSEDRTLIYISRDTDHLEKFDRIYYLENGKIVESGNYKELMKKKGSFYKHRRVEL